MRGRSIEEFERQVESRTAGSVAPGRFQELLECVADNGRVSDFAAELADQEGRLCTFRCAGLALKGEQQSPWVIVVAEQTFPSAPPSSLEGPDRFITEVGRMTHSLSNVLTALLFEWDLVFGDDPGQTIDQQAIEKLSSLISQAADESKAVARLFANHITRRKQSQ